MTRDCAQLQIPKEGDHCGTLHGNGRNGRPRTVERGVWRRSSRRRGARCAAQAPMRVPASRRRRRRRRRRWLVLRLSRARHREVPSGRAHTLIAPSKSSRHAWWQMATHRSMASTLIASLRLSFAPLNHPPLLGSSLASMVKTPCLLDVATRFHRGRPFHHWNNVPQERLPGVGGRARVDKVCSTPLLQLR